MAIQTQHSAVDRPGRLESHPTHRALARPRCVLQRLDPEDLHTTMCVAIDDSDKRLRAAMDKETFHLHLQFVRAHGLPKGEFTTFSDGSVATRRAERDE